MTTATRPPVAMAPGAPRRDECPKCHFVRAHCACPTDDDEVEAVPEAGGAGAGERDPNGLSPHTPGAKLDAGKIRPSLVLGGFARALVAVCEVGTQGAVTYCDGGWVELPNGIDRYDDAKLRHWLSEKCGVAIDAKTKKLHAAHEAWNALARLDLILREEEAAKALGASVQ